MPFFIVDKLREYASERTKAYNYHQDSKGRLALMLVNSLTAHEEKELAGIGYPISENTKVDVTKEFSFFKALLYVTYQQNLSLEESQIGKGMLTKIMDRTPISSISHVPGLYNDE